MKKVFIYLIILLMISVFSLVGCKSEVEKEVEVAEKAAVAAEIATVDLSTQELVDSAQVLYSKTLPLVTALETGAIKDDLIARLETVKTAISSAKVLLAEAAATEAVVAAEAATVDLRTQELVDMVTGLYNTANDLVTALPEGTFKDDLTARLVVVQDAIEEATSILAGPKIAFESDRDGNYEIYIMNIDGSEEVNLTNNLADDREPCFSPDGSKISFISDRDGNYEIYIMKADGSEQRRLTNNTEDDWGPYFSPDGSKIAFMSYRDGNEEIYLMNVDGSGQVNLTNNPADDWWQYPFFSPDGSKIVFMSYRDGNTEVYSVDSDGKNLVNLSKNSLWDGFPCWSPDGSKIAFVSERDGNNEIYVMDSDGKNLVNLSKNSLWDGFPCWSPDGSRITFVFQTSVGMEICVVDSDGKNQVRLSGKNHWDESPKWSPDGSRIAFIGYHYREVESNGSREIYVMDSDGKNRLKLTDNNSNLEYYCYFSWSPDGSRIAFMSSIHINNNETVTKIYIMDSDGKNQIKLTDNGSSFSWSPR